MPRVPAAQGRLNHDPGFHLSCDENLSEGWGPPLNTTSARRRSTPTDEIGSKVMCDHEMRSGAGETKAEE